jgi:PhnB protein
MSITLTPYLAFNGNTREVFRFYEQALGAKIEAMMSFDDMPKMPEPAGGLRRRMPAGDGIMHACL